jgi:hypothetical protein
MRSQLQEKAPAPGQCFQDIAFLRHSPDHNRSVTANVLHCRLGDRREPARRGSLGGCRRKYANFECVHFYHYRACFWLHHIAFPLLWRKGISDIAARNGLTGTRPMAVMKSKSIWRGSQFSTPRTVRECAF